MLCSGTKTSGKAKVKVKDYAAFAEKLGIGEPTLRDIVKELNAPGRDPREDMPKPVLRSDVLSMEDLKEGMILKGTVRNVIDFGAFVDIGVHQDGLVHISEMSDRKFVKHPLDVVGFCGSGCGRIPLQNVGRLCGNFNRKQPCGNHGAEG